MINGHLTGYLIGDTYTVIVDSPLEYKPSEFTVSAYHGSPSYNSSISSLWCCVVDGRLIFPRESDSGEA
jgi:hypothetical protein